MKSIENFQNNSDSFRGYEIFDDIRERDDIFEYVKGMTEYVHDNDVKNIVFIDSSARAAWVGVDEYWKQKYADEEKPGMFFVNPSGFEEQQDLPESREELFMRFMDLYIAHDGVIDKEQFKKELFHNRDEEAILKEFEEKYKVLIEDKGQPVLLFDTCAHTGGTIKDVKNIFEKAGFTDIKIIIARQADEESGVEVDAAIHEQPWFHSCYPFGTETALYRSKESVTSRRNEDPHNRQQVVQTRQEIRHLVKDRLENPNKIIL